MHRSRLTHAFVDVPADRYETETAFWSGALGRVPRIDPADPDYAELGEVIPGLSFGVQRVDDAARVHLDIETDDVEAEVRRLEGLGARRWARTESWWVMRDPAGLLFCVVPVVSPESFAADAVDWSEV